MMSILGVIAAIAVLIGGVQTAVETSPGDQASSITSGQPTIEIQATQADDHQTWLLSSR